jgi:hypothetical protein
MLKSDILATEYRGRAQCALATAEASPLLQVRLRHESAASVWLDLAAAQDRRTAEKVAGRVTARAEPMCATSATGERRCTV